MRRAFIFLILLFLSVFCFAQQNSAFRVIGRVPNAGDNRLYQIQVGAFRYFQNAERAYQRLSNASFNPAYDNFLNLTRVVINGVAAGDVPSYLQRIRNTGFTEVIIRVDSSRVQPPAIDDITPIAIIIGTPPPSVHAEEEGPIVDTGPAPVALDQQELPPPTSSQLLPAPVNIQPESGRRIEAEELQQQQQSSIVFSWTAVDGATGYILTIRGKSQERELFREVEGQTDITVEQIDITIDDLTFFKNNGDYAWHVEAIRRSSPGVIEQRGRPSQENTLTIDVHRPGRPKIMDNSGEMHGNL